MNCMLPSVLPWLLIGVTAWVSLSLPLALLLGRLLAERSTSSPRLNQVPTSRLLNAPARDHHAAGRSR
jgi:hypothetical protein